MLRHFIAVIVGVGIASLAHAATNIVEYVGATPEEASQLSGLAAAGKAGELARLKYLDNVVLEHPANAPARLDRASTLMQMSRMEEARKDLDELARRSPECFNLPEAEIYYYRIKGDRNKELEAMKALANRQFKNDTARALAAVSIRSNKPRIAELAGDIALAKKEWQMWVDEAPPQFRADRMTDEVLFYLRQGDCRNAVAVAKAAVELHRRQSHEGTSPANTLTWYGFSLWASGKKPEALAAFLDAAEQPIEDVYANSGAFDSAHRALAILGANVLAANGSEKEKATTAKLMNDLSKSASGKSPYSLEPVVLALNGKSEMKPVVETVAKVLKQAPDLDWALWAALYLGLSGHNEAKPLLTLLPNGSIQRLIAEQEGNAPTTRPAELDQE